jgi:hypothetical protein
MRALVALDAAEAFASGHDPSRSALGSGLLDVFGHIAGTLLDLDGTVALTAIPIGVAPAFGVAVVGLSLRLRLVNA